MLPSARCSTTCESATQRQARQSRNTMSHQVAQAQGMHAYMTTAWMPLSPAACMQTQWL
jgi:hypothetical protein